MKRIFSFIFFLAVVTVSFAQSFGSEQDAVSFLDGRKYEGTAFGSATEVTFEGYSCTIDLDSDSFYGDFFKVERGLAYYSCTDLPCFVVVNKAKNTATIEDRWGSYILRYVKPSDDQLVNQADELYDEGNYSQAALIYLDCAKRGHVGAQYMSGRCYYYGEGFEENNAEAEKWLLKAHQGGWEDATDLLFSLYRYTNRNAKAADLYIKAYGSSGDVDKYSEIGNCYNEDQKYTEAVKWWLKAADGGEFNAMAALGRYYEAAYRKSQNSAVAQSNANEAFRWFRKAVDAGNVDAKVELARCYEMGIGTRENSEKAFKLYLEAAECGNNSAIETVAMYYGIQDNLAEAVKWYRKLADEGDAMAMCNIAELYERDTLDEYDESLVIKDSKGDFIQMMPRHPEEVIKWYRMAAEAESTEGMMGLARCYKLGIGARRNYDEAASWYKKATEEDPTGYVRLAELALMQNRETEAESWYKRAMASKDSDDFMWSPAAGEGQCGLAALYANQGKTNEAIRLYKDLIPESMEDSLGCTNMAVEGLINIYLKQRKPQEAARYNEMVEGSFDHLLLNYYEEAGMFDEAEKIYKSQVNRDPCYAVSSLASFYMMHDRAADAVNLLRKHAAEGNALAVVELAQCYIRGTGVVADLDEADRWLKKYSALLDTAAMVDVSEERDFIAKAKKAKASGGQAMFNFSKELNSYSTGYENPLVWLQMSVEAGYVPAMYHLAMACLHESGNPDTSAAIALLNKAANAGDDNAKLALAQFAYEGTNGIIKKEDEAVKTLQALSGKGVDGATLYLARIYSDSDKKKLQKKAQNYLENLVEKARNRDLDLLAGIVETYLHNPTFCSQHQDTLNQVLGILERKGTVSELMRVAGAYEAAGLASDAERWYKLASAKF